MSASKFVLKHGQIEVEYAIGITTPGTTALIYKDGLDVKEFGTSDITTNKTALGSLVSISLQRPGIMGRNEFGFFLPELNVPVGQTEKFTTVGVYAAETVIPQHQKRCKCSSIELHGTAHTQRILPQDQPVTP